MKDLSIQFDSPTNSYYSGQTVTGRITFICDTEKIVRGLRIKYSGIAYVKWSGRTHSLRRLWNYGDFGNYFSLQGLGIRNYPEEEIFFEHSYFIFGNDKSEISIPPGAYSYPFQFTLRPNLPSTFESAKGFIQYEVKAVMLRDSFGGNYTTRARFTLITMNDLNINRRALTPLTFEKDKRINRICCKSGIISFILHTPRRGFVPGEIIPVMMKLFNNSRKSVRVVVLKLKQNIFYDTGESTTEEIKTIAKAKRGGFKGGNDPIIWNYNLPVPPITPTNTGLCQIIQIYYTLHIEMKISGVCTSNLKGKVPITICSIPIDQSVTPNPSNTTSIYRQNIVPAPPSYEELEEIARPSPYFDPKKDHDEDEEFYMVAAKQWHIQHG